MAEIDDYKAKTVGKTTLDLIHQVTLLVVIVQILITSLQSIALRSSYLLPISKQLLPSEVTPFEITGGTNSSVGANGLEYHPNVR